MPWWGWLILLGVAALFVGIAIWGYPEDGAF